MSIPKQNYIIGAYYADRVISKLEFAVYAFCDFRNTTFEATDLSDAQFVGCNFENATFSSTLMHNTVFEGCFSSVYGPIKSLGVVWEEVEMHNSHLVIEMGVESLFITLWEDDMEELLWESLDIEGMGYSTYGRLERLFEVKFENALYFGFHMSCAMFVPDGFQRGRNLERIIQTEIYQSQKYSFLCKVFILSFLGDEYHAVRLASVNSIGKMNPNDAELLHGVNRIFDPEQATILKGLRQLKELLSLGYVRLINADLMHQIESLNEQYPDESAGEIYFQTTFILDEIDYLMKG